MKNKKQLASLIMDTIKYNEDQLEFICVRDFITTEDIEQIVKDSEDLDEVFNSLDTFLIEQENFFDVDIFYNDEAMQYLIEYDPSLKESVSLAHDLDYKTEDLSSSLLASLHASEAIRNKYPDYIDCIKEETRSQVKGE